MQDIYALFADYPNISSLIIITAVIIISLIALNIFIKAINNFKAKVSLPVSILFDRIKGPLYFLVPVVVFSITVPFARLTIPVIILEEVARALVIVAVTALLIQVVNAIEQILKIRFNVQGSGDINRARKLTTQIQFIKRLVLVVIFLLAIAIFLMKHEQVKEFGLGLLTSAGIISVVLSVAAQRTLGSVFAGSQIAFTQPIRLGDALTVENEFGTVEEIGLTYVTFRTWDKRCIMFPINYFMEKPFQNWSRNLENNLLVTAFIEVDYVTDVNLLRTEFDKILNKAQFWNKRNKAVHVTKANVSTMEVRLLASANNVGDAFELHCYIREEIIGFIQSKHPEFLPRARVENAIKEFSGLEKSNV